MDNNDEFRFEDEPDESLREHLTAFRADAEQRASRPEWFWTAQRAAIRERTSRPQQAHSLRWAFVSTLALVAIASSLLVFAPSVPHSGVATNTLNSQSHVSDDALMRDLVDATSGTVPDALSPATLLADEVDRGLKSVVKSRGETR